MDAMGLVGGAMPEWEIVEDSIREASWVFLVWYGRRGEDINMPIECSLRGHK
jgi:hypothetical protein